MATLFKTSKDVRLYIKSGGNWTEITIASSLDVALSAAPLDTSVIGSSWATSMAGLSTFRVSADLLLDSTGSSSIYETLRNAWAGKTAVELAVADGDITSNGTHYWDANCIITDFTMTTRSNDLLRIRFAAEACEAPEYKTVGS